MNRYRVTDENPYLGRDEEHAARTIETAATLAEDLTGIDAAQIESDLAEEMPWKWTDDETGREVTIRLETAS